MSTLNERAIRRMAEAAKRRRTARNTVHFHVSDIESALSAWKRRQDLLRMAFLR